MGLRSTAVELKTTTSIYPGDYGFKNPIYPFLSKNYMSAIKEKGFEIMDENFESFRTIAPFFYLTSGTLTLKKDNTEGQVHIQEFHDITNTAPFCSFDLHIVAVAKRRTLEEFLDSLLVLEELPIDFNIRYEKKGKKYSYEERLLKRIIARKKHFAKKTDEEVADAFELAEFLKTGASLFGTQDAI